MGMVIVLQDESGNRIEAVEDAANRLGAVLPGPDEGFVWAATIDPYGDTLFNYLQAEKLVSEWKRIMERVAEDETRRVLEQVERLLNRVSSERHLYVKFIGD